MFLFVTFPSAYYLISSTIKNERTDYPGKKIAQISQDQWKNNFSNQIETVVGYGWINGWYAQNLSYHLETRPKWKIKLDSNTEQGTIWIQGFNQIKDCTGVLYQIEPFNDICMIGKK